MIVVLVYILKLLATDKHLVYSCIYVTGPACVCMKTRTLQNLIVVEIYLQTNGYGIYAAVLQNIKMVRYGVANF